MKSQQVITAVKRDRWSQAAGTHDDVPFLFRFREELRVVTDFTGYLRLLIVSWTYTHDDCSGIPDEEELNELQDFENHLVESFEHDFLAVLAAVLTERGTRQWLFYTSDTVECQHRLNAMPQKAQRYPIELIAKTDAGWSCFRDKIQTICGAAAS